MSQVDQQRDRYTCLNAHVNTLTEKSFVIFVTFSPRAPVSSTVRLPPLCHTHPLHPAAVCTYTHTQLSVGLGLCTAFLNIEIQWYRIRGTQRTRHGPN